MNTYWRNFRGRMVLSPAGRQYKVDVWKAVLEQKVPKFGGSMLRFRMEITPRDKRKFDIDNRIKGVFDALQAAGIMEDDWQVVELYVARLEEVEKPGKVVITLETVDDLPISMR